MPEGMDMESTIHHQRYHLPIWVTTVVVVVVVVVYWV
jgi:hypothetical protein